MVSQFSGRATKSNAFNMTELILALFIAFLGAVSIIGVFPVGFDATRKAMGTIQAADAANQFLFYFANEIRADWEITQAFPDSKPMSEDGDDPAGNGTISGAGVSTSGNGNSVGDGDGDGVRNGED